MQVATARNFCQAAQKQGRFEAEKAGLTDRKSRFAMPRADGGLCLPGFQSGKPENLPGLNFGVF